MRKLVLATTNQGKISDFRKLLAQLPTELVELKAYPEAPYVEETGKSFKENALLKAKTIGTYTQELTLADDTGLAADFLNGEPGIYSARYGGLEWDDRKRCEYLLKQLNGASGEERAAWVYCVIAVFNPKTAQVIYSGGAVRGLITDKLMGCSGSGYDPVFYMPEMGRTFAQLPDDQRIRINHRGKAVLQILPQLRTLIVQS